MSPLRDKKIAEKVLIEVPLGALRAHPANANQMSEELLAKLEENIRRQQNYPPLIVRPLLEEDGVYQVLDGHQRLTVLVRLGFPVARCYLWPCSDAEALVLLATLNRLSGEDNPAQRAKLLEQLAGLFPSDLLASLLPEGEREIEQALDMLDLDLDRALDAFSRDNPPDGVRRQAVTFALTPEEAALVEAAIERASERLEGTNRRAAALCAIAQGYLDQGEESGR